MKNGSGMKANSKLANFMVGESNTMETLASSAKQIRVMSPTRISSGCRGITGKNMKEISWEIREKDRA